MMWLMVPALFIILGGLSTHSFAAGSLLDAIIAVLLTLPWMLCTLLLILRLHRRAPAGAFVGMTVGMIVKGAIAIAGGLAWMVYAERPWTFLLWLALAYLVHLAVEIVIATRLLRTTASRVQG
jgi:hypothetical protein